MKRISRVLIFEHKLNNEVKEDDFCIKNRNIIHKESVGIIFDSKEIDFNNVIVTEYQKGKFTKLNINNIDKCLGWDFRVFYLEVEHG